MRKPKATQVFDLPESAETVKAYLNSLPNTVISDAIISFQTNEVTRGYGPGEHQELEVELVITYES